MAKVSQQQKEEFKYKQCKKALERFNVTPESAVETHLVCNKIRNALSPLSVSLVVQSACQAE